MGEGYPGFWVPGRWWKETPASQTRKHHLIISQCFPIIS